MADSIDPPTIIVNNTNFVQEQGRYDEAWNVLRRLHSSKADHGSRLAQAEFIQIKAQIEVERVSSPALTMP